jgi:citrate lyase beta subunit
MFSHSRPRYLSFTFLNECERTCLECTLLLFGFVSAHSRSRLVRCVVQYVNFRSSEGLRAHAMDVKKLGYRGMFAIHPNQVDTLHRSV